jgi:hypothetical protein
MNEVSVWYQWHSGAVPLFAGGLSLQVFFYVKAKFVDVSGLMLEASRRRKNC